jgi:hypothetical protein
MHPPFRGESAAWRSLRVVHHRRGISRAARHRVAAVMVVATLLVGACATGPVSTATPAVSAEVPAPSPATASAGSAASAPAATSAGAPAPAILVGAGDIASCGSSGDEATAALLDGIEGTVFTAGDNAYESGSSREFADCYGPTWGRSRARTLPVPGNHDYKTAGAAGYFAYFGAAAGNPSEGWYARDLGVWRIYALNSNCGAIGGCGAGSAQERWLRADLAANPRACVLAIWHHPRFSSGEHGSSDATAALWAALAEAGAEIVVTGHDHDYERFAPQTADGVADPSGIVEFVVGTGGRSHYTVSHAIANSLVRNDDTYGVLRLELYAASWSSSFVPVAGGSFTDTGTGTCH